MSKQVQQRSRLHFYQELGEIIGAMKNMAEVELHRSLRMEQNQKQALSTVVEGMALLMQKGASQVIHRETQRQILLVIGSERGFCGGFNEQLSRTFILAQEEAPYDEILLMGERLALKLEEKAGKNVFPGPSTVDEILPCIQLIMDLLTQLSRPYVLSILAHGEQEIECTQLLPSRDLPHIVPKVHVDTTCKRAALLEEIEWQLLYQGCFRAMLVSFIRENRMRLQQMEGAREHIDTLINSLQLRLNTLRQQEIVEEIEMILVGEQTGHAWGKIQGER